MARERERPMPDVDLAAWLLRQVWQDRGYAVNQEEKRWSVYLEGGDDGWAVEGGGGHGFGLIIGEYKDTAEHVANWDPERVLAECDAKQRIIEAASAYSPELEHGDNGEWAFDQTLRLLALPYADRPGYRDEWRP